MQCIIIYQKSDGTIFVRTYKYDQGRKVGDETSMGWKVLNVLYECDGNYYQHNEYLSIKMRKARKRNNKKIIRKAIKKAIYKALSEKLNEFQRNMY